MLQQAANFVSVVFQPLLLPTYAIVFINWANPYLFAGIDPDDKMRLFVTIFVNTFIFPVLAIFIMWKLNFVKSFLLKSREERIIPYIAISLFYFWCFMVIRKLGVDNFLTTVLLGSSLSVFMAFFFNLFFKISVHTVGAGNFIGIGLFLALSSSFNLEIPLMFIFLIAGFVGSARLYLKTHNQGDIYSGYVVGFLGQFLAIMFI